MRGHNANKTSRAIRAKSNRNPTFGSQVSDLFGHSPTGSGFGTGTTCTFQKIRLASAWIHEGGHRRPDTRPTSIRRGILIDT